jgi:hypothetical protein
MGSLSSAHSHEHACMPSNASRRQPPSSAALWSHFEHGTVRHARGPVETATHQKTHARMPTAWAACAGTPLPHGWYYARLGTSLRLGARFALEPTPEKLLKNFKPVFLSESCSWAGFKSEATPPAHEYFAGRVPNPAQEQSPNAAPAALVVCNLPRACS